MQLISEVNGLNKLRDLAFTEAEAKGFHTTEIKIGDFTSNLHSEVSELWEAHRLGNLNKPCDKSEKMMSMFGETLTCLDEEIADILIRTLDTGATFGVDVERAVRLKILYNRTREYRNGGKLA